MPTAYIDPYVVLGLTRSATAAEIKQAYFALVRTYPPEREPAMFKRVRAAYERLRDPEQRIEADMVLFERWPASDRTRRASKLDLTLQHADVIAAARSLTDLSRSDWRDVFEPVKL